MRERHGPVLRNRQSKVSLVYQLEAQALGRQCVQGTSNGVWVVLTGFRVGASSVSVKRARGLVRQTQWEKWLPAICVAWSASFCLLLVPGAQECPQAPQDDAGRETPERKAFRKIQVIGSVSQALCASSG
eukprot:scaffold20540_cov101-Isochrysis_galbana.AAC.3